MMNKIWGLFIIVGVLFGIFTGNIGSINDEIIGCGEVVLNMVLKLFPIMALWLGIMNIALVSGLLGIISRFLYPITRFIFPDIPKNSGVVGLISSSFVFNMFGLGNAATPVGLKAMNGLKELSNSDCASRSMITFLVLNTTGFTIIPTTIISVRLMHGSVNPSIIVFPCVLASFFSTVFGLVIDRLFSMRSNV